MKLLPAIVASLCAAATVLPGYASADGSVVVAARETRAEVTPRPANSRLVNLPTLEFALRAAIKCKGDAVSVTLSVSDTHETLRAVDLTDQRAAEITLKVPAQQLALAASKRFCVAEDPASEDELLVSGFATAHASLRCDNDGQVSAHFASAPLQLRLDCLRETAADDQVEPEPAEPR